MHRWVCLIHVFTGAICLFIELYHTPGPLSDAGTRAKVEGLRELVQLAIDTLRYVHTRDRYYIDCIFDHHFADHSDATNISFIASRAVGILENMREQEQRRRAGAPAIAHIVKRAALSSPPSTARPTKHRRKASSDHIGGCNCCCHMNTNQCLNVGRHQ